MASNIENKINRIASNVTAALTAIAEKGVTVPDGADSDDLAGLIGGIPASGGCSVTIKYTSNGSWNMNLYMNYETTECSMTVLLRKSGEYVIPCEPGYRLVIQDNTGMTSASVESGDITLDVVVGMGNTFTFTINGSGVICFGYQ